MSRNRAVADPRWDGVEVANLWKIVCRETEDDLDKRLAAYETAARAIAETGKWKEWEAVKRPGGQIKGYRRLRAGDWFIRDDETGVVQGPFATKKLCLAIVRAKSGTKIGTGVYTAAGSTLFTRAQSEAVLGVEAD